MGCVGKGAIEGVGGMRWNVWRMGVLRGSG